MGLISTHTLRQIRRRGEKINRRFGLCYACRNDDRSILLLLGFDFTSKVFVYALLAVLIFVKLYFSYE